MSDWLDKFDVGNRNFEATCRLAGGFIFIVSAIMVSMMVFDWGLYASSEFRRVVPAMIYYSPIPAAIGSLFMLLKPSFFKPKEKKPK